MPNQPTQGEEFDKKKNWIEYAGLLESKLAAANQEVTLLKGKLEEVSRFILRKKMAIGNSDEQSLLFAEAKGYNEAKNELLALLTPRKEEK